MLVIHPLGLSVVLTVEVVGVVGKSVVVVVGVPMSVVEGTSVVVATGVEPRVVVVTGTVSVAGIEGVESGIDAVLRARLELN